MWTGAGLLMGLGEHKQPFLELLRPLTVSTCQQALRGEPASQMHYCMSCIYRYFFVTEVVGEWGVAATLPTQAPSLVGK